MSFPEITVDYTSGQSDLTSYSVANPIRSILAYGAGTITLLDCSGASNVGASRAYVVVGGEVITGAWQQLTSTTCSRIRVTTSNQPLSALAVSSLLPVNLAGGANYVTGILPATNGQDWLDAGTVYATGFVPLANVLAPFNLQLTANINFPKITAALNGISVGLVNVGTGATASILVPSGTDSMGPVAALTTAATAAGPASLKAQRYTANVTLGQWIPGV